MMNWNFKFERRKEFIPVIIRDLPIRITIEFIQEFQQQKDEGKVLVLIHVLIRNNSKRHNESEKDLWILIEIKQVLETHCILVFFDSSSFLEQVRFWAKWDNAADGESLIPCFNNKQAIIMPVRPFPPLQWIAITFRLSCSSQALQWLTIIWIWSIDNRYNKIVLREQALWSSIQ